jgi:hypothetical protein
MARPARVQIIQTGTRLLARTSDQSSGCPYRIIQDGLPYVQSFVQAQRVDLPPRDLFLLLQVARC